MSLVKTKEEHLDIRFLRIRIQQLINFEEYEKCARIQKWIEELTKHHDRIKYDQRTR